MWQGCSGEVEKARDQLEEPLKRLLARAQIVSNYYAALREGVAAE